MKMRPPQTGLLSDLFRSIRPVPAVMEPTPDTARTVNVAALPKARGEMPIAEH